MVRATAAASLLCLLVTVGAGASTDRRTGAVARPASTVLSIVGRGWGHGIGMSQYGAYGFARRGWAYPRILAHYFRGTQLGSAPVSRVRVLLATGRTTVRIGSAQAFRVRDAEGESHEL